MPTFADKLGQQYFAKGWDLFHFDLLLQNNPIHLSFARQKEVSYVH
jgi:hypothetical protein